MVKIRFEEIHFYASEDNFTLGEMREIVEYLDEKDWHDIEVVLDSAEMTVKRTVPFPVEKEVPRG